MENENNVNNIPGCTDFTEETVEVQVLGPGATKVVEEIVDAKPEEIHPVMQEEEDLNDTRPIVVEGNFQETSENTTHDYKAPEVTITPDIVTAEKDLTELKQIGEEITKLEERLESVPDPAQPQVDPKKYSRKQRRQMERHMKHQQKLETKQMEQKANTFATRRDLVQMHQSLQKLRDRLYYVDILNGAIECLLIEKGILTEEEIKDRIKKENTKAMLFQEIQKGAKDYDNRLNKCLELQIDPNISIIGQQIYEDPDLDISAKVELAQKYDLKILLQALGNLVSPKQEGTSIASETSGDKGSE